jgi:drug/metabolite transporter (DMT)-like permease
MPRTASRFALALSPATRAALALAGAALFWSGAFIAGRALRDDVDPAMLTLLRWSLAFVAFIPFVGRNAWRSRQVLAREWRLVVALGATGLAAFHTLTNLAMHTTTALNAILMLSLVPATILIGGALSGASRPSRLQWAGTTISLVGACVLITRGSLDALLGLDLVRGDLWMIVSVLLWTAYSLLLRRRPADLPPDAKEQRLAQLFFKQRFQLWWRAIHHLQSVSAGVPHKLTRVQTHLVGNDLQRVTVYQLQPLFH